MDIEVLKFGGSSLASANEMRKVSDVLLARRQQQRIVVCSAMAGITNDLIQIGLKASRGDASFRISIEELESRHMQVALDLGLVGSEGSLPSELQTRLRELKALCDGLFLIKELSAKSMDQLVSFGERMAVPLVAGWLRANGLGVRRVDARDWLVTDDQFGSAEVNRIETDGLIQAGVSADLNFDILITEGFIGRSASGATTTLGRGGSDYTASIIASAIQANCMEKSTDVPGMLTADPRIVADAKIIEEMSYEEAMELCHFGAKVIYHPTIQPLRDSGIPLIVRSTFQSNAPGTRIVQSPKNQALVRGLSSVNDISLITLEGGQLIGRPGFSSRIFSHLAEFQVNVVLITQSSSENSLTLGVADSDLEAAKKALISGLEADITLKRLAPLRIDSNLSILAIVGGGMVRTSGVSGKAFQALADANVNVRAIAQGSTERNISIVVRTNDVPVALRALHSGFFDSNEGKRFHVFCAGIGQVGSAFMEQMHATRKQQLRAQGIDYRLVGACNSKRFFEIVEGSSGIPIDAESGHPMDSIQDAYDAFLAMPLENKVWVDNTASAEVAAVTIQALRDGISVVCSNKIAATESMDHWRSIQRASLTGQVFFQHETNVGAALPILSSLRGMLATGDQIQAIEGVLSGSLNFIFSSMDNGASFQSAVEQAVQLGFAEPDARLDLSGRDVARKILILARTCGAELEMDQVNVQGFMKEGAMDASLTDFMQDLEAWAGPVQELHAQAKAEGKRLRYVARWDAKDQCGCSLEMLAPDHPFYGLEGTDNAVAIFSLRYADRPLVIQGAGAGAAITASGVLSDLHAIGQSK